jgi:hypothetical protein
MIDKFDWKGRKRTIFCSLRKKTPCNIETHLIHTHLAINRCNEIYRACYHNLGFHKFNIKEEKNMVSTDKAMNAKRVTHPNLSTQSPPSSSQTSWDDEEEVSNNNTNAQSLAAAIW